MTVIESDITATATVRARDSRRRLIIPHPDSRLSGPDIQFPNGMTRQRDHGAWGQETAVSLQLHHHLAARDNLHLQVVRTGFDVMTRMHDHHMRSQAAAWETVKENHWLYVQENRRFTITLLTMGCLITFLVYFLGVYTGENAVIKGLKVEELGLPVGLQQAKSDRLGQLAMWIWMLCKGVVEGYLFVPLKAPWMAAKGLWHGVLSHASSSQVNHTATGEYAVPGLIHSNETGNATSIPGPPAAAALATGVHICFSSILWVWCYPANFLNDFLITLLALCGIPHTITVSTFGIIAIVVAGLACTDVSGNLNRTRRCRGLRRNLRVEFTVSLAITLTLVTMDRLLVGVFDCPAWLSYAIYAVPLMLIYWEGLQCDSSLLICVH